MQDRAFGRWSQWWALPLNKIICILVWLHFRIRAESPFKYPFFDAKLLLKVLREHFLKGCCTNVFPRRRCYICFWLHQRCVDFFNLETWTRIERSLSRSNRVDTMYLDALLLLEWITTVLNWVLVQWKRCKNLINTCLVLYSIVVWVERLSFFTCQGC